MDWENIARKRARWSAALMGLTLPGMGQVYNGELLKGLCFFTLFLLVQVVGLRLAVLLPDGRLLAGVAAVLFAALALYLAAAAEAWRRAGREELLPSRPYNRWYVYLTLWLVLSVVVLGAVLGYTRSGIIEAYRIPSRSMEPAVLRGDMLLADKTYYRRHAPQVGDIVVFVYPDDRSKVFMKRIAALPGAAVAGPDGSSRTVLHGHVYVLGDNPGQSVDSREFGVVPLRDLLGRMRQVYFSWGEDGVRWDRIGAVPGRTE